jgi:hypothetical protein
MPRLCISASLWLRDNPQKVGYLMSFAILTAFNRVKVVSASSASEALALNSHLTPKGIASVVSPYRSV